MAMILTRPETRISEAELKDDFEVDFSPARKRFTRDEYHYLAEIGILAEGQGFELIEGDIVENVPQKQPHTSLVMLWVFALARAFGEAFVWCQMPTVLSEISEPEPDIMVTAQTNKFYLDSRETPKAAEIRLAIEVAVSSLAYDVKAKAFLYAKASIPEYWVIDVASRTLIVHRDPKPDGYATVVSCLETESVSPLAKPEATFKVSDYLP